MKRHIVSPQIKIIVGSLIALTTIACMVKIDDSQPITISSNAFSGEKDGIMLWAEPYTDSSKVSRYFGHDLLNYGILPVFIRVQNSGRNTLLLQAGSFTLSGADSKADSMYADAQLNSVKKQGMFEEDIGAIILGPILGALVKPGPVTQYQRNMNAVKINMQKKALKEQTVFRTESVSGFIYVTYSDKQYLKGTQVLKMDILTPQEVNLGQIAVFMQLSNDDR